MLAASSGWRRAARTGAGVQPNGTVPFCQRCAHEFAMEARDWSDVTPGVVSAGRNLCAARNNQGVALDRVDRRIISILRRDARTPVSDIAREVGLSSAPVSRRISRLETAGVITGYTVLVDDRMTGALEAFTEVRLSGGVETGELGDILREVPEVQEFFTIAGDPDALVRIRVDDVDHLQRVVNAMRRTGKLTGTKTLIVMHSWSRLTGSRDKEAP